MIAEAIGYLGPAKVLADGGQPGYVHVEFPGQEQVLARIAMAVPYTPAPGDEVLVICREPAHAYVIGVLDSGGMTTLRVPRDLRIEAPHGAVQIVAARGIRVQSDEVLEMSAPRATWRFARLNVLVTTLVERLTNRFTWATDLLQSKSRRARNIADEGWLMRAGSAHVKTTDNVHINGKTIHLG